MGRGDTPLPAGSADSNADNTDDIARHQRIAAMRALAGEDATRPPVAPRDSGDASGPSRKQRRTPLLMIALTALILVATVGAALWQGWLPWQRAKSLTTASLVSINLAASDLYCPSAAVWSPDNQRVAVLTQFGACTNTDIGFVEPNVVAIFSLHGRLERLLYPDTVTLGKTAPSTPQPTPISGAPPTITIPAHVQYLALAWSPDGKELALPYFATAIHDQSASSQNIATDSGVALLPVDGATGDRLSSRYASSVDVWDIQARRLIRRRDTVLPPSLAYQWSPDGALTPVGETSPTGPVGNPLGGQSFTIWQPGSVYLDRQKNALELFAGVSAWSPDGRYLAPYLGFGGEITPGISGVKRLGDGSYQLAPRDSGLRIASGQLKSPDDPYVSFLPVAWRDDGRVIATLAPNLLIDQVTQSRNASTIPSAAQHVVIYDCATGAKRLTLATKPAINTLQVSSTPPQSVLRWSSTGDKLFLLDTSFDTLSFWNVHVK